MFDTLHWNEHIRYERLKRGWSQEKAAEHLGVDPRTVRDWEAGDTRRTTIAADNSVVSMHSLLRSLGY